MSTAKPAKGPNFVGAIVDFLILVLLVGGAGLGGYYWGTIQRMAPVKGVPEGTAGALPAQTGANAGSHEPEVQKEANAGKAESNPSDKEKKETATTEKASSSVPAIKGKNKYWICSSGSDYIGYSITVSVNGTPVDSFFGPGKTVDITRLVKDGENSVSFDAKEMGAKYNKHKDDKGSELILQVVSGPMIQESFKSADVLISYKRNAAESEDYSDTERFVKE